MDERVTLRSHLDRSASQTPHGAAVGEVIEAIATAAIDLAALIADGPLAGITGQDRWRQSRRRSAKGHRCRRRRNDAPRVARCAGRGGSVRGSGAAGNARSRGAALRRDRSARRIGQPAKTIFRSAPSFRSVPAATTFSRPSSSPARRNAPPDLWSTARRPRWCWRSTAASISSFSIGARGEFLLIARGVRIAPDTPEFAINASNRRHWHGPVRAYIDECLAGTNGDRGADFNMRWIGSLVAESLRILVRGGVFLYPADARPGYREGRLAASVRSASDGAGDGVGGRRRDHRTPAHPGARRARRRTSACR